MLTDDERSIVDGGSKPPDEVGVGAFAEWVRSEREKKGWSVAELAEKSGMSIPAIYNIERGTSRNPQAKTRARLRDAFGTGAAPQPSVPDEPEAHDPDLETADGLQIGELEDFDPHATADLPECTGVYVLYDVSDRPVYVGKATRRPISTRLQEHYEKFWFKPPVVNHAAYVRIDDERVCAQIERVLIKFMKSNAVLNKQYVVR